MSRDEDGRGAGGHKGVVDVDVMIATQKVLFSKSKRRLLSRTPSKGKLGCRADNEF